MYYIIINSNAGSVYIGYMISSISKCSGRVERGFVICELSSLPSYSAVRTYSYFGCSVLIVLCTQGSGQSIMYIAVSTFLL